MKQINSHLRSRKIGLFTSIAFAVGAMIGGGVFVLSGLALKQTGASAILAFLLAGIMVLFSALSFGQIAAQKNSSHYSGYAIVGKVLKSHIYSFIVSWSFYLAGIIGAAFVLNAFGVYLTGFILHGQSVIFWAIIAGLILTIINLGPASEIGKVENILVGLKLIVLILLVVFGLIHFHLGSFHPFFPHGDEQVLVSSAFLFIAFLGFNVITNISSDIKNPTKTIPRAITLSMLIVTIIYVGVIIALLDAHIKNYSEASVGTAAQILIGPIGGVLIVIGALVSTLSSANANILGSSEIMVRMALDKQVPTQFGRQYKGHPYYSVLFGGLFYSLLIWSRQTNTIIGLANVTAIVGLIVVNLGALKINLIQKSSTLKKIYPIIGIITAGVQFFFMPLLTIILGFLLILTGLIIYRFRNIFHLPKLHLELVKIFDQISGPLSRSLRRRI